MRRIFLIILAVALLFFGWSVGIEPGLLVVRNYDTSVRDWPAALSDYRIVFISDIHYGSLHVGDAKLRDIVDTANAQSPDLILLGGDFLSGHEPSASPDIPNAVAATLAGLKAKDGVYAVLGNHDNWINGPLIRKALEEHGIGVLDDISTRIARGGDTFTLVGISDFTTGRHDVETALAGIRSPAIALTHSPDVFPAILGVSDRVGLVLAGHTHGGQVYVPFLGRPIVPSIYGQRYAIGLIQEGGGQMFVTPGIGTSIVPIRFLTPPEISVLHLAAAK